MSAEGEVSQKVLDLQKKSKKELIDSLLHSEEVIRNLTESNGGWRFAYDAYWSLLKKYGALLGKTNALIAHERDLEMVELAKAGNKNARFVDINDFEEKIFFYDIEKRQEKGENVDSLINEFTLNKGKKISQNIAEERERTGYYNKNFDGEDIVRLESKE